MQRHQSRFPHAGVRTPLRRSLSRSLRSPLRYFSLSPERSVTQSLDSPSPQEQEGPQKAEREEKPGSRRPLLVQKRGRVLHGKQEAEQRPHRDRSGAKPPITRKTGEADQSNGILHGHGGVLRGNQEAGRRPPQEQMQSNAHQN
ncbi:hypothetical protein KOW79_021078 [Hemibagrus wyckioides]|uniref:Uncharacterized protein n=1 Tax=Hemibagrus wyckioides TaxID=337641 RepID=A0A9D3S961_9TELE|nr:hypothetical protein KOW79_021078 [Hemibagrus wyckioides]